MILNRSCNLYSSCSFSGLTLAVSILVRIKIILFVEACVPVLFFIKVEHMKTMKSSVLSAGEFFQLTVNSLLELCTHSIDRHRIVSIEGHLMLTLDTGDKVALNILQQDVRNVLNSVEDKDDANKSPSVCYLHSVLILDYAKWQQI